MYLIILSSNQLNPTSHLNTSATLLVYITNWMDETQASTIILVITQSYLKSILSSPCFTTSSTFHSPTLRCGVLTYLEEDPKNLLKVNDNLGRF